MFLFLHSAQSIFRIYFLPLHLAEGVLGILFLPFPVINEYAERILNFENLTLHFRPETSLRQSDH